jgi:hypothetical protein
MMSKIFKIQIGGKSIAILLKVVIIHLLLLGLILLIRDRKKSLI